MKKENILTNKKIGIFIKKETIRIKNCSKAQKYFHRLLGHDIKVIELALSLGLKEGLNEMSLNEFLDLCSKLEKRARLSRTIKFCLKTYNSFSSIKWKELKKDYKHLIRNATAKVQIKKAFKQPMKIK